MQLSTSLGFAHWLALAGVLLLLLSLSSAYVQRMPISSSSLYLGLGLLLGPRVLGWMELRFGPGGPWFERLTEVAIIVALFISGLKLRLPPKHEAWRPVYRLAGPVMLVCIGSIAWFGHAALGLSWPASLLLGAVLAPTDPVLAGAVSVSDASDRDRVKYALSGEAGLNDGTAFPFVVLALAWQRQETESTPHWLLQWAAVELLWAVVAGLAVGYGLGRILGRWAISERSKQRDTEAPSDFAALSLIALAYTAGELIHAWSFLAVFAAGVGLRSAEVGTVRSSPHPEHAQRGKRHPPAEHLVSARVEAEELQAPAVAAGVLVAETMSFGSTVERILEVVLVTLVGVAVGSYWDARALLVALLLFCVVRPLATYLLLARTKTSPLQRLLVGWFGIRGIGSLYYLAYAQNHGGQDVGAELTGLTISVIALSILVHGSSATPLLSFYERRKRARASRQALVRAPVTSA
ncbi:MAG: sodium/hydrogen exchanger family protein [Polyangiaceae bacterium]|nr:sodium/hydrogen exchanger family protein [Polyangiaceae bacterium]